MSVLAIPIRRIRMRKSLFIILAIIATVIMVNSSLATTKLGGRGLIATHSAEVLGTGHLDFFGGTRFFGEIESGQNAFTLWNVQGFTALNLGVNRHIEFGISPIVYQDTNSDDGNILDGQANFPDDLFISMKVASFAAAENKLFWGGMLTARIPTAEAHNILYEPYSAGRLEVGITGLLSYFSNALFHDEGWSLHGNIGYLNHNDVGKVIVEGQPAAESMTSELLFGVGVLFPAGTFDFSAEIHGRHFLVRPPEAANTRGYVSYLTSGVYYHPYRWMTLEMGFDIRLLQDKDLSDYPDWRGMLGVKFGILPFSLYRSEEKTLLERRDAERRRLLQKMIKEQEETQDTDSELSRIRAERERIEEELKRLRKLLEEEKKKKKKGGQEG